MIGQENIQHLLRSTLVKLNSSKELPIIQSLILVFAHLLYIDLGTILIFLNSLPAPDGTKSALEFVLNRWLSVQLYFNGYENKASAVALCRLFQHSLSHGGLGGELQQQQQINTCGELNLINLHQIEVECDDMGSSVMQDIYGDSAVRTRSKAAQESAQTIHRKVPASVKILKLLLNEYNHLKELKEVGHEFSDADDDKSDGDSEDVDTEEDDLKHNNRNNNGIMNSNEQQLTISNNNTACEQWLGKRPNLSDLFMDDEPLDTEEEEEILSEEIAAIDLEDVLRQVLTNFKSVPFAGFFLSHLTSAERELLNNF